MLRSRRATPIQDIVDGATTENRADRRQDHRLRIGATEHLNGKSRTRGERDRKLGAVVGRGAGVEQKPCVGSLTRLDTLDDLGPFALELAGILNRVRRNCRVALLGDPNQLLSVGAGNILSDLLTLGVPSICLQQQYRQSTDAAALRQNVVDFPKLNGEYELRWDDSFRLLPADDRAIPDLLCEEAARRYRAGESIQVLSPVRAKTGFSVQALNTRLQNEVNPLTAEKPAWGKFRDGDRVIVTQNNAYYNICNGDVGVLHIRGEKPHRVAALAVRGTLKTWQIDRGQGGYGIGHDDAPRRSLRSPMR